jgi:hypothetical protein
MFSELTELFEHLVALVEDEVLDVLEVEFLAPNESENPARGAHDDVRAVGLEHLLVLRDGETTEKHADLKERAGSLFTSRAVI